MLADNRPEWVRAILREGPVRRGLVLHGNVRDLFYDPGSREYVALPELLDRIFAKEFTPRFRWDRVDGLRVAEADRRRLEEALSPRRPASGAYDAGAAPRPPEIRDLNDALACFRKLGGSGSDRPLLVLDGSHLLVADAEHLGDDERRWVLHASKALAGSPVIRMDTDALRAGGGGLLVLVAADLAAVPLAVYHGDPRVRLIEVPLPSLAERREFFMRHADDLRVERSAPRPELAESFADLSDGLATVDLRQILTLSLRLAEPLPPEKLLNLYRLGDRRSPWEELGPKKLLQARETLRARVVGQEAAVESVVTTIERASLGLAGLHHSRRRTKPKGTLFFVGPTGVGKTELAKACAEFLFGEETAYLRFDMSEYALEHSADRLVGAPPGFTGFEQGGQLVNAVRSRPFSVLLFDEIEKANKRVLDKFLQILEDGRLTDGRGETAYFSESLIIFTSNIGAASDPGEVSPEERRKYYRAAVEKEFASRPELLNRLGENIVVFDRISDPASRRVILERKLKPVEDHLRERFGLGLVLAPRLIEHIVAAARDDHGGRGLLNVMERDILNPLARFLSARLHQAQRGRVLSADLGDGAAVFELREGTHA